MPGHESARARGRASAGVRGVRGARGARRAREVHNGHGPTLPDIIFSTYRAIWIFAGGTWCSGITSAQRAGGLGSNPQRVQLTFEPGKDASRAI